MFLTMDIKRGVAAERVGCKRVLRCKTLAGSCNDMDTCPQQSIMRYGSRCLVSVEHEMRKPKSPVLMHCLIGEECGESKASCPRSLDLAWCCTSVGDYASLDLSEREPCVARLQLSKPK